MMIQAFIEGELGHFLNAQSKAVGVGGRKAMRIVIGAIRKKIAANVRRAGFRGGGAALAKTVRSRVAGKGADVEGIVYSKATYARSTRRPGGPIDLVQLFAQGATIRAASGELAGDPDRLRAAQSRAAAASTADESEGNACRWASSWCFCRPAASAWWRCAARRASVVTHVLRAAGHSAQALRRRQRREPLRRAIPGNPGARDQRRRRGLAACLSRYGG